VSHPSALDGLEVRYATFRDRASHERADLASRLRGLRARERVLVDTCHRVELICVEADPEPSVSSVRGTDAVRRVFEVVAGFDSAVVAEEQLLRQVRGAYESALTVKDSGPILNELMQRALRFGRLVRSHARPGTDRSLADPAVAWLVERVPAGETVAVAGTGEMGRLLAVGLATAGRTVIVVSRSAERAERLLAELPGSGHRLVVGPMTTRLLDAVMGIGLAVRSRSATLTGSSLEHGRPPWVVDLSAPSAVDSSAADRLGDRLLTLDELGAAHAGSPVLSPATEARLRRRLDDEVDAFVGWVRTRSGADALALLHREADGVRRRHLDRLRRRAVLDDAQLAEVEAASAAMLGELLHGPTIELRHGGADAATVRRLFRIET
jgi:glutamyl-tRNA reductase